MPKRESSRAVTLVSSHRMRSTLRNTHSPRNVMSPRLPIGVATKCRPAASSCSGAHDAVSIAAPATGPDVNDPVNRIALGLLGPMRWLGSRPPLPETPCAALAFLAVRLTDRCFRSDARADGLHARPDGSGAARSVHDRQ